MPVKFATDHKLLKKAMEYRFNAIGDHPLKVNVMYKATFFIAGKRIKLNKTHAQRYFAT